tara:strand:- start:185 stop:1024 length:840 start_codon:yes stop_codon:yes gene_type:complete
MDKIIWIASYPKSGNTFLRFLISSLIYSDDGNFDFDIIKNIRQFDIYKYFSFVENLNYADSKNLDKLDIISKYWLEAQKKFFNVEKKFIFKTHSANLKVNGYNYTDENRTLGVIYIVRDPRDIVISYSHHTGTSIDHNINKLFDNKVTLLNSNNRIKVILSRWDTHIKSWSLLNVKKYIIKYEDLINNTEKHFLELIDFIRKDLKIQFKLNSKKFKNIITNTSFKKLQENENIIGFDEVYKGKFFRKGLSKQWENILSEDQNIKIKKEFYITLKKFNYI